MLTDEDVYLSGLLCYANMISVGTTCFAEAGGPHPDAMGARRDRHRHPGIRVAQHDRPGRALAQDHDHHHQEGARRQCRAGEAVEGRQGRHRPGAGLAVAAPDHDLHARADRSDGRGGARARRQDPHPSLRGRLRDRLFAGQVRQAAGRVSAEPGRARPAHALRPLGAAVGKRDGPLREAQAVGLPLRLRQLRDRPAPAARDVAARHRRSGSAPTARPRGARSTSSRWRTWRGSASRR